MSKKTVLTHYVDMTTYEVPASCPTYNDNVFTDWLSRHEEGKDFEVVKNSSRDFEIVDIRVDGEDKFSDEFLEHSFYNGVLSHNLVTKSLLCTLLHVNPDEVNILINYNGFDEISEEDIFQHVDSLEAESLDEFLDSIIEIYECMLPEGTSLVIERNENNIHIYSTKERKEDGIY